MHWQPVRQFRVLALEKLSKFQVLKYLGTYIAMANCNIQRNVRDICQTFGDQNLV